AMNVSDMAASAMLMPPEADPVMPASTVTVMASLTSGLGIDLSSSAITVNPGNSAMTPPNPYSDAVLTDPNTAPPTPPFLPPANFSTTARQAKTNTARMPKINAPSPAQMAATAGIWVTIGLPPSVIVCCAP